MAKKKLEFRYYNIPAGEYVLPKIGDGWIQHYGVGYEQILHFHNYMEIGYNYYGKGQLIIEDRVYHYGAEPMFSIIPANMPHNTMSDEGHVCSWEFLFIDIENFVRNEMSNERFDPEEVIRILNKRGTLKTKANHARLDRIIQSIIEECRNEGLYYKETIKGYLRALVIELLRLDEEREAARRQGTQSEYLTLAIKYVQEHYAEDLHIADLAKQCGLSESHFRRVFEESMNMKPADFVNMVRVQNACNLILKGNLSMAEVGYRVGYTTSSTFDRNFSKITGKSPRQWKGDAMKKDQIMSEFNVSALKGWEGLAQGQGFTE